jgi:methylated-DNA-[protein]-cysteine S-methyltransferase
MEHFTFQSPLGPLCLTSNSEAITAVEFATQGSSCDTTPADGPLRQCHEELLAYFAGSLRTFTVPVVFQRGTEFQRNVWRALQTIPYGTCISYRELAETIERPKAARAVGNANNKNPLAILVPCHRVIGASGGLVGYASGVDKKRFLLELEGYLSASVTI